ncbi:protein kintoun isoform X1 [Chiroxiphia lanceolata]|uniref:protein kintoun isoform X1 n=1 Tax=Chiroxiphia lanceolata TaxID=296741 RepID=UPI0013CE6383|nr:protein kintoun isoform X1 [Chiroxiphia lanceolata]
MAGAGRLHDLDLSAEEAERLRRAFRDEKFRALFAEYAAELTDPEQRRLYEEEVAALERERGVEVRFVHPSPGFVLRTSQEGSRRCYINVCSNAMLAEPRAHAERGGQRWALPYSLAPGREELRRAGRRRLLYDVVFHPAALRLAARSAPFRRLLCDTALDAVERHCGVRLDRANAAVLRGTRYKGVPQAPVIRSPLPGGATKPPDGEESPLPPFPYPAPPPADSGDSPPPPPFPAPPAAGAAPPAGPTTPRWSIRHRSYVDLQDYRHSRDSAPSPVPRELVVTVELPLLRSAAQAELEIRGRELRLDSVRPAYRLRLRLPYAVDESGGRAAFNRAQRQLQVTLPVVPPAPAGQRREGAEPAAQGPGEPLGEPPEAGPGGGAAPPPGPGGAARSTWGGGETGDPPGDPPTEPPAEPPPEPPTEPLAEPLSEPLSESPAEQPAELPADPPAEPLAEPLAESPAGPLCGPPAEPLVEPPTEPPSELLADPPAELLAEPAEPPAEPLTEPPTESPTDPLAEPQKPPAEPLADPPTEPPAEPPSGPPPEPAADPPAESPTEPPNPPPLSGAAVPMASSPEPAVPAEDAPPSPPPAAERSPAGMGATCPPFQARQDEASLTLLLTVPGIHPQSLCGDVGTHHYSLRFSTASGAFALFLQFPPANRLLSPETGVSVSAHNVVVELAKAPDSTGPWEKFSFGLDPSALQERLFVTEENVDGFLGTALCPSSCSQSALESQPLIEVLEVSEDRIQIRMEPQERDGEGTLGSSGGDLAGKTNGDYPETKAETNCPAADGERAAGTNTAPTAETIGKVGCSSHHCLEHEPPDTSSAIAGESGRKEPDLESAAAAGDTATAPGSAKQGELLPRGQEAVEGHEEAEPPGLDSRAASPLLREVNLEDGSVRVLRDHVTRCPVAFQNSLLYELD